MMLRLLALIGVVFLVVKGIRLWLTVSRASGRITRTDEDSSRIDDVMVKDPYCQVYFPRRDGVHLKFKGRDLFFCSETCRDKFLEEHK